MSKLIPLSQGEFAIVDDADYNKLCGYNWYIQKKKSGVMYAIRHIWINGKRTTMRMHREILKEKGQTIIDHINRNGLDNRKSNLRKCSSGCNAHNSKIYSTNTSGYKGVTYNKDRNGVRKYIAAYISNGNKGNYLGRYKTEVLAAEAYDQKAIELFGEFALTNKKLGLLR